MKIVIKKSTILRAAIAFDLLLLAGALVLITKTHWHPALQLFLAAAAATIVAADISFGIRKLS
ncbi:MAG: hypothetical protein QMD96_06310 [Anaerosomatales bacterium]|nr:hypothetical protein [Anaerosomatales bacterium]